MHLSLDWGSAWVRTFLLVTLVKKVLGVDYAVVSLSVVCVECSSICWMYNAKGVASAMGREAQ
jgi:hypothetical protein